MGTGTGMTVGRAQLPVLRDPDNLDPVEIERRQRYKLVRVVLPKTNTVAQIQSRLSDAYKIEGDTIQVLEIAGPEHVAISMGRGDYIPVKEGAILRRAFGEFRVRTMGFFPSSGELVVPGPFSVQGAASTTVLLAVSWGTLIEQQPWKPAFRNGFPIWRGTAPDSGTPVVSAAVAGVPRFNDGTDHGTIQSLLKWGGTLFIRNLSDTVSLFLYWDLNDTGGGFNQLGTAGACPVAAWEMLPGDILSLDAASRLDGRNHGVVESSGFGLGGPVLCVAAKGAGLTAEYCCMASGWGDCSDQEGRMFVNQSINGSGRSGLEYDGAY